MTTGVYLAAAYPCSLFKSSKQIALQTRRPIRRHPHASFSLCAIRVVAALDEKQASAVVNGVSLARPIYPNSLQSSSVTDGAGDGSPKDSVEPHRQVRLRDLRIGCIYKGKVSVIESYGVFVDIGAYTDGFIHISRLGRAFVRRVEDVVKVGQDVCVQIVDLDLHTNNISLLLRPEQGLVNNTGLSPVTLPEQEVLNRAAARRANKLARRAENPSPRRVMSLETRRHLKAYRRSVLAERQAIQLHLARSRARIPNDLGELDEISKAKC